MNLLLTSLVLWGVTAVLFVRLIQTARDDSGVSSRRLLVWGIGLAGAVLLLFRPHEDYLGGQDQGAYLNAAHTYARRGTLSYTDPLLSQIPEQDRPLFFYQHGNPTFPDTKYMCFWVPDVNQATIGAWFQPAYPVMMSLFARLSPGLGPLYVTPLFALLAALALGFLARQIFPHRWSGEWAFFFFGVLGFPIKLGFMMRCWITEGLGLDRSGVRRIVWRRSLRVCHVPERQLFCPADG
jgi:hypothetical protein